MGVGMDKKKTFDDILQEEFNRIIPAERHVKDGPDDLIGLAFSGGGIRSATFNLGVLQTLADADLLKKIDYLSTVSGGGYIGAFFTSMLARPKQDGTLNTIEDVQAKLCTNNKPNGQEAPEISFLRQYSNYLTPKIGLSTDALSAFSVWLTNTILNQVVLISMLMCLSALVFAINGFANTLDRFQPWFGGLGFFIAGLAFGLALRESWHTVNMLNTDDSFTTRPQAPSVRPSFWRLIVVVGWLGVCMLALWFSQAEIPLKLRTWLSLGTVDGVDLNLFWLLLPALAAVISLLNIAIIGILGRKLFKPISSFMREWWARIGGVSLFIGATWLLMFVCMLYLPLRLEQLLTDNPFKTFSVWGALTWVAVYLAKSPSTSGLQGNKWKEKLTALLPWLAIFGLVVAVSFVTLKIAHGWFGASPNVRDFAVIALFSFAFALFSAMRVDVNIFSLHYFYRNRLTRGYLGATHNPRYPSPFTGFDEEDDVLFHQCVHRPLHIVNTALNLTSTKNLAWQQRMAASFAFTPLNCGFEFPDKTGAYRPTTHFTDPNGVKLGSIVAVSGAAASPNMGYHSSPAAAFLMTVFNVRLGRWYGNPALNNGVWKKQSPDLGLGYLAKELFAKSDESSNYLYLSDGGHFENLGIYELVRRRCKLVIAIDVGQDSEDKFEDLGNAIRKCQTDFGVTIDMRVDSVRKDAVSQLSSKHYAIGKIQYPQGFEGVLVYIKSSLTGNEPADLQNYKKEQPAFPHHSTADQFFDEKQFESYRHLGQHVMVQTLKALKTSKPNQIDVLKLLSIKA